MKNLSSLVMPHGPWFIYEPVAHELWAQLQSITVEAHESDKVLHVAELRREAKEVAADQIDAQAAARDEKPYDMRDGIAVFDLNGPMTKIRSSWGGGTSTAFLRRQIEMARKDEDVRGAVIRIDSPGGSVAGTDDLAREVAAFARAKPIYGYVEDMGCSAAYWVGSQCTKLYANATALVGSLGTFAVVYDMSRAAENAGVKAIVLSTGKYKGAGTPGAAVTGEQIEQYQATVDDLNDDFIAAVARGRSMPKARTREMFDGSVDKAPKALAKGLIDGVSTEVRVLADVRQVAFARAEEHHDPRATFEAIAAEQIELEGAASAAEAAKTTSSGEEVAPAAIPLAEETEALLADARLLTGRALALKDRLAGLKDTRAAEGRDLSVKATGHIDDTCQELATLQESIASLQGGLQALKAGPPTARAALHRELLAAEVALAS